MAAVQYGPSITCKNSSEKKPKKKNNCTCKKIYTIPSLLRLTFRYSMNYTIALSKTMGDMYSG